MPFGPKNVSTTTVPPMSAAIESATLVISVRIDIRSACTHSTRRGEIPFDRAMLMASLCSVRIMSARSKRLHAAPSPSSEDERRDEEVGEVVDGVVSTARRTSSCRRTGRSRVAFDDEEQRQHGDHEGGVEMTANEVDAAPRSNQLVSSVGTVDTERHGDEQPDDDRPEGDEHRRRQPLLEHLEVRLAGDVRVAEVTGEDVLQPVDVLHRQRVVEVRVVRLDLRDPLLADGPAREIAGGVRSSRSWSTPSPRRSR